MRKYFVCEDVCHDRWSQPFFLFFYAQIRWKVLIFGKSFTLPKAGSEQSDLVICTPLIRRFSVFVANSLNANTPLWHVNPPPPPKKIITRCFIDRSKLGRLRCELVSSKYRPLLVEHWKVLMIACDKRMCCGCLNRPSVMSNVNWRGQNIFNLFISCIF